MPIIKSGRAVAAVAVAALLVATGVAAAAVKPAPAATPVAAAVSTSDLLVFARNQLALCQVELHDAFDAAARQRAQNCITDAQRAIADLSRTPGPTPSASPTATPSPTVVPTSASPSPTPAPTTTGPSPTPSPSPTGSGSPFPDASNTGVPPGTQLTAYTGLCTISVPGTVIDAKTVNCDLHIVTSGVVIKRSKINGSIGDDETDSRSFSVIDSEVNAGAEQHPAVWHTNYTVLRSNIHGGQTSIGCVDLCVVKDSWLHGQVISVAGQHLGGFLSNGGGSAATPSVIEHNTIACDPPQQGSGDAAASCSGAINLFGDFAPISHLAFRNNFIHAAVDSSGSPTMSYCIYGGDSAPLPDGSPSKPFPTADNVEFTNNIIENGPDRHLPDSADPGRTGTFPGWCGWWKYGISSFNSAGVGNIWSGNMWSDGAPALPDGSPPA